MPCRPALACSTSSFVQTCNPPVVQFCGVVDLVVHLNKAILYRKDVEEKDPGAHMHACTLKSGHCSPKLVRSATWKSFRPISVRICGTAGLQPQQRTDVSHRPCVHRWMGSLVERVGPPPGRKWISSQPHLPIECSVGDGYQQEVSSMIPAGPAQGNGLPHLLTGMVMIFPTSCILIDVRDARIIGRAFK